MPRPLAFILFVTISLSSIPLLMIQGILHVVLIPLDWCMDRAHCLAEHLEGIFTGPHSHKPPAPFASLAPLTHEEWGTLSACLERAMPNMDPGAAKQIKAKVDFHINRASAPK